MPEVYGGEEDLDVTSPTITNKSPNVGEVGVAITANLSFTVLDNAAGVGVDSASIDVQVDGANAIINGVFQAGWNGVGSQIVANGNGYDVTIDPTSNFVIDTVHELYVFATDIDGNAVAETWEFTVSDATAPIITPQAPAADATGIALTSTIVFNVIDDSADPNASGVDLSTLDVYIEGDLAVSGGIAQPGYSIGTGAITDGYQVTITLDGTLPPLTEVTVDVEVDDLAGNTGTKSWNFTTVEGDIITPTLKAVPGDERVNLTWSVPDTVLVTEWRLRKSDEGFPTSESDGIEILRSSQLETFIDYEVVNGKRYYYTIFLVRRYDGGGNPLLVPYDTAASDDATPRLIVAPPATATEYVPARGEIPQLTGVIPGASVRSDDGRELSLTVKIGTIIRAPFNGTLKSYDVDGGKKISISKGDVVFSFEPVTPLAADGSITAGKLLARAPSTGIKVTIDKKPGRYIRPFYAILPTEKRDG